MAAGKLIVFEGPEGVGKSTQVARLAEHLSAVGVPHVTLREPGGTKLGEQIRALVLDPAYDVHPRAEALLFLAARAQIAHAVRWQMQLGRVVLMDRFFLSTYAYQIAGRGLPEKELLAANRIATDGGDGLLIPDLTLLLMYPFGAGLERVERRGERDRIERADLGFHERVAAAYSEFLDPAWQRAHPETGDLQTVDARGSVEEVFQKVLEYLGHYWPETFRTGPRSHKNT